MHLISSQMSLYRQRVNWLTPAQNEIITELFLIYIKN